MHVTSWLVLIEGGPQKRGSEGSQEAQERELSRDVVLAGASFSLIPWAALEYKLYHRAGPNLKKCALRQLPLAVGFPHG